MSKDIRHRMSVKHENYVAELFNTRRTPGSGNQLGKEMDGRTNRYVDPISPFAWDCKSTFAKSISVTVDMWEKAKRQAGGEKPLIPLRLYADERMVNYLDLVVLSLDDLMELIDWAKDGFKVQ